jgi:acyl-CoA thioesterase I
MYGAPSPTSNARESPSPHRGEGRERGFIRYLALGDSYTIGTGASDESHNYPSIVARRLSEATGRKVDLTNPAVNGYTTDDLIRDELPYVHTLKPDLVSILIGVNDLVQGRKTSRYSATLGQIYDEVAALALYQGRVAAISIPTWSYAPAAADFGGSERVETLTDAFNDVAEREALGRGFTWVDIGEASLSGVGSAGWIALDGLHPGDAHYAAWADAIWKRLSDDWRAV